VTETGESHGLRDFVARSGQQFMFLHGTPDGQAVVAGIVSDLTPEQLVAAAGGQIEELGVSHGLRGIFVSNGSQFQVFYATPDGARVIPGAMWDAAGKNLTRDRVSVIPGTIQAVDAAPVDSGASPAVLPIVENAAAGTVGDPEAPKVWMFIDPLCPFSVRALQQLRPMIADKRLQVAVLPIAINDYENGGRSTASALAMLSLPPGQMVAAWASGDLDTPASPDAFARLDANSAAAKAVGLRGTPTLIWRKPDGGEGRSDGLPPDLVAFTASVGR
jgi:protein-disulfide isomerase